MPGTWQYEWRLSELIISRSPVLLMFSGQRQSPRSMKFHHACGLRAHTRTRAHARTHTRSSTESGRQGHMVSRTVDTVIAEHKSEYAAAYALTPADFLSLNPSHLLRKDDNHWSTLDTGRQLIQAQRHRRALSCKGEGEHFRCLCGAPINPTHIG